MTRTHGELLRAGATLASLIMLLGCEETTDAMTTDAVTGGMMTAESGGATADDSGAATGGAAVGGASGGAQGGESAVSGGAETNTTGGDSTGGDTGGDSTGGDTGGDSTGGDTAGETEQDMSTDSMVLADDQTLIPDAAWSCGLPEGIPGPALGEPVFELTLELGEVHDLGQTPYGHRVRYYVEGGTVSGELDGQALEGTVLEGGFEYSLALDNGVSEVEQILLLQLGDATVYMRNCGIAPAEGVAPRVVLDVEAATDGPYAALNSGTYVATRELSEDLSSAIMKVHRVSDPAPTEGALVVERPADAKVQPYDCKAGPQTVESEFYRAAVDLTPTLQVGVGKRGDRRIAPIVGGTITGMLNGSVVPGGADYQLWGEPLEIDARYLLQTEDGAIIAVRNCGTIDLNNGATVLTPTFEAAVDGPYAYLNEGSYVSSMPFPNLDMSQVSFTISKATE